MQTLITLDRPVLPTIRCVGFNVTFSAGWEFPTVELVSECPVGSVQARTGVPVDVDP